MRAFVGCAWYADHYGSPVHEFIVVDGAEFEEGFVWVGLVGLELGEDALDGGLGS
jgi:hypothetical protein